MPSPYDYASEDGYDRARPDWVSWPSTSTVIREGDLDRWDQAIYDLKTTVLNVKDYGAVGDGTTDDTAAVELAMAAAIAEGDSMFLPPGTYDTSLASAAFSGRFAGSGQLRDSGDHKRAPMFSAVKARPSSLGAWSSPELAYDGDISGMQLVMEHRITGAATMGQPSTGYLNTPEACPAHIFLYNESGWNEATASNDGRTGAAALYTQVYQSGQGDLACHTGFAFAGGPLRSGATSFLANPAAVVFNGGAFAGADGVYLNVLEFGAEDQGFDVAAVGLVLNMNRTEDTGALDTMWGGIRIQNSGSKATDVGVMLANSGVATEGYRVGIDLSAATLATTGTWVNAAITMSADQRIYFDSTPTDAGSSIYRRPSATGDSWIEYDTVVSGLVLVADGEPVLQLQETLVLSTQSISLASGRVYQVNGTQVVQSRQTGWTAPTGTLSRSTFDQSTVTTAQLAQRVAALITDLTSHGLIGT